MVCTATRILRCSGFFFGIALLSACGWVDSGVGGNEPPVTDTSDYQVVAGEVLEVDAENGVLADDVDRGGRSLTAALATEPQHASEFALQPDGAFRYVHDGSDSTADRFEYTASDQIDASEPTPVTIRILHPPRAADDTATTDSGKAVQINVLANDADSDDGIRPDSVTIVEGPARGTAQANADGTITYTPEGGFAGSDSFTYRVSDEDGLESNPARVTVEVRAVRLGPLPAPQPTDAGPAPPPEDPADEKLRKELEKRAEELAKRLEKEQKEAEKARRDDDDDDDEEDEDSSDTEGDDDDQDPAVVAEDDSYEEAGTGVLIVGSLSGVLANDRTTEDAGGTHFSGVRSTVTTNSPSWEAQLLTPPTYGKISLAPDGSFEYRAGEAIPSGGEDRFTYRLRRGGKVSAPATVSIRFDGVADACWVLPPDGALEATLPAEAPEASPKLYRIEQPPAFGELSLRDQTTGAFAYRGSTDDGEVLSFSYSVSTSEEEPERYSGRLVRTPRLLVLGNGHPADDPTEAEELADIRYALSEALEASGRTVDWVGSQSTGPTARFDPDHELHPGWGVDALAWGREGYPRDGIRAWLDANPADVILLHASAGLDPTAVQSLVDELQRWANGPDGNPLTLLAPAEALASLPSHELSGVRLVGVDAGGPSTVEEWLKALRPVLNRCP